MSLSIFTVSEYAYCPRSCFYYLHNFYANHTLNNDFIQDGKGLHNKKLKYDKKWEKSEKLTTNVKLYSEKLDLIGRVDLVAEQNGKIYPIECKRGKTRKFPNLKLQLVLEAICLEEMYNKAINRGFIYFFQSNRRLLVDINEQDKQKAKRLVIKIRKNLNNINFFPLNGNNLCPLCSYYHYCH
jgi:CRISPR-associated protein Cas4